MPKHMILLALAALSMAARADAGEPDHVRVIWDVGRGVSCATATPLSSPFSLPDYSPCVPPPAGVETLDTSTWSADVAGLIQRGDYVTVYAYNYNAVSYKALAPVVTTLKPEEPVGITLLTSVLQAIGFKVSSERMLSDDVLRPGSGSACTRRPMNADACLAEIATALAAVEPVISRWDSELRPDALIVARERPGIPRKLINSQPPQPPEFGIAGLERLACRFSIVNGVNPIGTTCQAASGWIQEVSQALGAAATLIRNFDAGYQRGISSAQVAERDGYKQALDSWIEYLLANQGGVRSQLAAGVAQLADDLAAIKAYIAALDDKKARVYAVEIPRQGPVGRLNTLLFALPLRLAGDPDGAPAQITRTYSVTVSPDRPLVAASAGVMSLPFGAGNDAQKLVIEQVPNGTGGLVRRLATADIDQFRRVTAVVTTNFRILRNPWVPYAAFGTSADRNIFKTVMLAPAWFVPAWRSFITIGVMGARGSTADDLQSTIDAYSTNGVVPDSINLAQVPVNERWRWAFTAGLTLTPF